MGAATEADVAEANATNTNANGDANKTLKITWVKSAIGHNKDQKATIRSLGLTRLYQTVEHPDTPQVRGQVFKVKHLLKIEE